MIQTYSEKLRNPKWQKKRLEIFHRDNFECSRCHAIDKELQVHHLDYIEGVEPWEYPNDMLTTLCVDCHNRENERPKHEKYLLQSLKMKGFLAMDILQLSTIIDINKSFVSYLKNFIRRERHG